MRLELFISRRASRQVERVTQWWVANRPGAPGAVREDLETTLALLLEQPDIGTLVLDASSPGVRRFHLERIRYWVYYRVRRYRLEVVSVWHSSRGQGPAI